MVEVQASVESLTSLDLFDVTAVAARLTLINRAAARYYCSEFELDKLRHLILSPQQRKPQLDASIR